MADGGDAEILQIVNSQFRQHRAVDFVVPERCLVLPQTEASQPISDIHRRTRLRFDSYDGPQETASLGKSAGRRVWGSSLARAHDRSERFKFDLAVRPAAEEWPLYAQS